MPLEKTQEQETEPKVPETTETPDGGIEVNLEEEQPQEAAVETPQEQVEEKDKAPKQEYTKTRNQIGYLERKLAQQAREIEELKNQPAPQPETPPVEPGTFMDILQKDPEGAIKKLAQSETTRLLAEERKKIEEQTQHQTTRNEIDKNSQLAVERHPELNDGNSEKSEIWYSILEKHPSWRNYPDGPLFVMREMEDTLRQRGYSVDGIVDKKIEEEKNRLGRVTKTGLPSSRTVTASGKITLTKEQREFCDENGMSYESYARALKAGGEVVV